MESSNRGKVGGEKRNFPVISQKYVNTRILVAYLELCKKKGIWCKAPLSDLLKKFRSEEQLRLIDKKTIGSLFKASIMSLRQGGRFDFDEETLWITREGKDYFNKNYPRK